MVDPIWAAASPQPAGGPSDPSPQAVSAKGAHQAQGLHILQHSLGVDQFGQGKEYRNYFVTGEGSTDYDECVALVADGLMTQRKGNQLTGEMDAFFVTDAGKRYVADHSPPPPKLTRGQKRYREWLDVSDVTGESFMEFCRRRDSDGARRAATACPARVPSSTAKRGPSGIAKVQP